MIRFHLDESAHGKLAVALRHRGIDVSTPVDARLVSASDEAHLAFALAERRVLVTQDSDFLAMNQRGVEHAGIVHYRPARRSLGELGQSTVRHLRQHDS